ncbi:MAG: hypothetical protein KY476_26675, partial [Planctomycetes bacterium]|nr:hypothetical protein [Planctomycetota bacterium]
MFFTRWLDSFRLRPRRPAAARGARRPARRFARHRLAFIESLESRTLLSAAPVVASFELANDTGTPGDYITNDPTLAGSVTDDVSADGLEVQIDADGDGVADDTTWTDTGGAFMYDAAMMVGSYGTYTIAARAGEFDMQTMQTVYGSWVSLTFTWENDPAEVGTFELANNVGSESLPKTVDGIVTGSVTNSDGSVDGVNVEFDIDGDGMADDYTLADSAGGFTHDLSTMLGYGQQTIYARAAEFDNRAAMTVYGGWVSL